MGGGAIVGVCGPMGVGKSTLVEPLAAALGLTPRLERVEDNPFFQRYTKDPTRWAAWSQLAFILGSINEISEACENGGAVVERPPEEMFGVFVRDLSRRGLISDENTLLLEQVVSRSAAVAPPPDLLVVLHADASTIERRLRRRAAVGDESYRAADIAIWVSAYANWRATLDPNRVIDRDITDIDLRSPTELQRLALEIKERLPLPETPP